MYLKTNPFYTLIIFLIFFFSIKVTINSNYNIISIKMDYQKIMKILLQTLFLYIKTNLLSL